MPNETSQDRIITQWGTEATPFRAYSAEQRNALLESAKYLLDDLAKKTGVECFLTYGGLLGAVREGRLISHDFDLDIAYVSPDGDEKSVADTARKIVGFLLDSGFHVDLESNGQFKAVRTQASIDFKVEFFASWRDGQKFFQYFAVPGDSIASEIFPLGTVNLEGISFPAPKEPAALLSSIYGPAWKVPNPNFRYDISKDGWAPFEFLFTRVNKGFWETYYHNRGAKGVWVDAPSQFAAFTASEVPREKKILDIGCGNGRDGLFFSAIGFPTTLVDYSGEALALCNEAAGKRNLRITTYSLNVADVASTYSFARKHRGEFDVMYSRFFLHAINELAQDNLLRMAMHVVCPGGLLMFEYRCTDPANRNVLEKYENGVHYRRPIQHSSVIEKAIEMGLSLEYSITGKGFAKYRSEDPYIGRVIFRVPV